MANQRTPKLRSESIINIILIIMIVMAGNASAEVAASYEMNQVCQNWLTTMVNAKGDWGSSTDPKIDEFQDIVRNDGVVLGRCYTINPRGFVIVPVLKDMPPIKMYSDENNMDINEIDGMAQLIKDVLHEKIAVFENYYGDISAVQPDKGEVLVDREFRAQWDKYTVEPEVFSSNAEKSSPDKFLDGGPLLTTSWHQSGPYNNLCPIGDGGRTVVGCVATATAQILWYWEWPPAGEGDLYYWWSGDNSCGGSSPGQSLYADFSDPYEYTETSANLAEICYEVGVAFRMAYGYCGSGAYTSDAVDVFPDYFRYLNTTNRKNRSSYASVIQWYSIIKNEIDACRPSQYRISLHSIVCDGYREISGLYQYHMNYGWGGTRNSFYTIDNLHCDWEGCDPSVEYIITGIEPDRGVMVYSDETIGDVPFSVNFAGESIYEVDSWIWFFGDGDSAITTEANCYYEYTESGMYDISLKAVVGIDTSLVTRSDMVIATSDTLHTGSNVGAISDTVEIVISGNNTIPLTSVKFPLQYPGDLRLHYVGASTEGLRSDGFTASLISDDEIANRRVVLRMLPGTGSPIYEIQPGSGPLITLKFEIVSGLPGEETTISMEGYFSYTTEYSNGFITYAPNYKVGSISAPLVCGDVYIDNEVDLLDIVFMIDAKFNGGPPAILEIADVNNDGKFDLLDIIYLIEFKFQSGPDPHCD